MFWGTAVVTEHGKDARRSPRKPSLAWRHLEAHAAQPASRAPIITVTRGAGVTSWKRTCKAYRFSHITYPAPPSRERKFLRKILNKAALEEKRGTWKKGEIEAWEKRVEAVVTGYERYIYDITIDDGQHKHYIKDSGIDTEIMANKIEDLRKLHEKKWLHYRKK